MTEHICAVFGFRMKMEHYQRFRFLANYMAVSLMGHLSYTFQKTCSTKISLSKQPAEEVLQKYVVFNHLLPYLPIVWPFIVTNWLKTQNATPSPIIFQL